MPKGNFEERIAVLESRVELLEEHSHDSNGNVIVPIGTASWAVAEVERVVQRNIRDVEEAKVKKVEAKKGVSDAQSE